MLIAIPSRSMPPRIKYHSGPNPTSPNPLPSPMQPTTETPIIKYHHHTAPLRPTDKISPLGSGNIFTDIIILDNETQPTQSHQRQIKCVRHPLDDRDGGSLAANWSRWRLKKLQSVLVEVKECRTAYWEEQPHDQSRFGRREALAREHSIRVIGQAIASQQERNRRERRVEGPMMCDVM